MEAKLPGNLPTCAIPQVEQFARVSQTAPNYQGPVSRTSFEVAKEEPSADLARPRADPLFGAPLILPSPRDPSAGRREVARAGGLASGEARRKKRDACDQEGRYLPSDEEGPGAGLGNLGAAVVQSVLPQAQRPFTEGDQ